MSSAPFFQIRHYGRVSSTQDVARGLVADGAPAGTVVVAKEQERGRGRFGRTWLSPKGGLYVSLILRPPSLLPLRAGIAVAEALRACGVKARLKWPNDVLVGERKIAGILIETVDDRAIVGIGVNLAPIGMPTASCLVQETSVEVGREELLALILRHVTWEPAETVLARYRALSATIGEAVRVAVSGSITPCSIVGRAVGIDPTGRLLVAAGEMLYPIASGECLHLRAASQERQPPG